jgi:hypothetical protein
LQAHEFGECTLLPLSVKTLISQVNQTVVVSTDNKLCDLQVRSPLLDCKKNRQILLFINRKAPIFGTKSMANECQMMTLLRENNTNSDVASINFNNEGQGKIG